MTEAKFTKGPWTVSKSNPNIIHKEGEPLNCVGTASVGLLHGRIPDEVLHANATLMSAAPDMYEALQAYFDWHTMDGELTGLEIQDMMVAALKKARGEK